MQTTTNRRALLKAAPLAAVTIAVPAVASIPSSPDRREWNAAMAAWEKITAEDAAFTPGWMDLWKRCQAECDRVPHVTLSPSPYSRDRGPITTADDWFVRQARHMVKQMDSGKATICSDAPSAQAHYALQREVVKAADEREEAIQRIRQRYGMEEADEEAERLGDAIAEAEGKLLATPAPDLAALRWKLDKLFEADRKDDDSTPCWNRSYVQQTIDDYQRLLGGGR